MFKELYQQQIKRSQLKTWKYDKVWLDLEGWRDGLAGPLYSIYSKNNCDYVFSDQKNRFKGIKTEDEFLEWCLNIVEKYRFGVNKFEAKTEEEIEDQQTMLSQAAIMEKLSHLAFDIQRDRRVKLGDSNAADCF